MTLFKQFITWKLPTKLVIFGQVKKDSDKFCSHHQTVFVSYGYVLQDLLYDFGNILGGRKILVLSIRRSQNNL